MKRFISVLTALFIVIHSSTACDDSSVSLISQSQTACNSTFVIQVCAEYLGLEGAPDAMTFTFNCGATVAAGFTPATYSTSSGDIYTGTRSGSVLTYQTSSIFIAHNANTLCRTFTITTVGHPTLLTINVHPGYPSAACTHTVALNPTSVASVNSPSICSNNTATLTASGCPGTVRWYAVASGGAVLGTGPSFTTPVLTSTTSYFAECVCSASCPSTRAESVVTVGVGAATISPNSGTLDCSNPSVLLTAGGGTSFVWSTGATTSTISVNTANTYSVTVSGGACTASTSVVISGSGSTVTAAISPVSVLLDCNNPTRLLTASGGSSYSWSNGHTSDTLTVFAAGTYTVTVTDGACTDIVSVLVSGSVSGPVLTVQSNSPVCAGQSIRLGLSNSAGSISSVSWTGPLSYSNTTTYPDIDAANSGMSGTYQVTMIDGNGCPGTGSVIVTVQICPEICGNGMDDDQDGLADGQDIDCPCISAGL